MSLLNKQWLDSNTIDRLIRGLYIVLFLVIGYFSVFVVLLIAILQFLANLIFRKSNDYLLQFGRALSMYASEVIDYITYVSDVKPFPFKPWPK